MPPTDPDGAALIVCATCRESGPGGGRALIAALTARAATPPYAGIAVVPFACLWSCGHGASVQLRAPGRIGYVMGGFAARDAGDLLDFALAYAATPDGEVPFDAWPESLRGRFIARTPAT